MVSVQRFSLEDTPWSPAPIEPTGVVFTPPLTKPRNLPRNFSRRNPSDVSSKLLRSASTARRSYRPVPLHLQSLQSLQPPPKPWADTRRLRSPQESLGRWGIIVV